MMVSKTAMLLMGAAWMLMPALPVQAQRMTPTTCSEIDGEGAATEWVQISRGGGLTYKPTASGDRLLDFSYVGYMGGGVAIPNVAVKQKVAVPEGDATAAIQSAIDAVSSLLLKDGVRGAVLLAPGTFKVSRELHITAGGVVLRGSGTGANGTTIEMTGDPHMFLVIRGEGGPNAIGDAVKVTDAYVPAGTTKVTVSDTAGFAVDDTVLVNKPVTEAWVHFMGMDTLVRDDKPQTWIKVGTNLQTERMVRAIQGHEITFDVPLSDSIDAKLTPGATVTKTTFPGRISQVGVESLRVVSPPQPQEMNKPAHHLLRMEALTDSWVQDVVAAEVTNSLAVGRWAKRVTIRDVKITHTAVTAGNAHPADFSLNGSQILLDNVGGKGDGLFYVVTGAAAAGPNVVHDCNFEGGGSIFPHQRWATGLLVDNCKLPGGSIEFVSRGNAGSGHGWSIGWGVVWNSSAKALAIQQPPGSQNFCIGCAGERVARTPRGSDKTMAEGLFDSPEKSVAPRSLYESQLCRRLGPKAVKARLQ